MDDYRYDAFGIAGPYSMNKPTPIIDPIIDVKAMLRPRPLEVGQRVTYTFAGLTSGPLPLSGTQGTVASVSPGGLDGPVYGITWDGLDKVTEGYHRGVLGYGAWPTLAAALAALPDGFALTITDGGAGEPSASSQGAAR